jgi:hypothetical protein
MSLKKGCKGFDEAKLEIGDKARVLKRSVKRNRIRCAPRTGGKIKAWLAPGEELTVVYGPVRAGQVIWWAVKTKNAETKAGKTIGRIVEGWTAEWNGKEPEKKQYYLEKVE